MNEVVVVDAVRTPFGKRGGCFAEIHPADLLGIVLKAVVDRNGLGAAAVDQIVCGCVEKTGEQGFNIPRTAWLAAGLPASVPATTIDVQCGSSQEAFSVAHSLVASDLAEVAIACGVESMSRVPMGTTFTQGPGDPIPPSFLARYPMPDQFASAEAIAEHWSVTRQDCDRLAVESNTRAAKAWSNGWFDAQIVRAADAWQDECIRATTPDAVAALPTFGADSVHTAATTSKVADGASAVLMMSSSRAAQLGLRPKAVIVDSVLVGVDPALMLTGPIDATRKLLDRSGIGVDKIDLIEINEAFASVVLAWQLELGVADARVNPNGGALATGHPLGATGTGLIAKAVHELERIDGQLALVTMCCGGALGTGTLLARR